MANIRRRQHIVGGTGSTHSFNLLSTKNSASLSALMSVETDAGLCHVTRPMKLTARANQSCREINRHTIFDSSGPIL